jgi:hypothetical protein
MPSDAFTTAADMGATIMNRAYVKQGECDGRYRVYPHHSGMFYLAAYTKNGPNGEYQVIRTLHGPMIRNRRCVCFFADEGEARGTAERLNVRLQ